jgi:hypothetical protein
MLHQGKSGNPDEKNWHFENWRKTRSIQTVISGGDVYDPALSEGYLKSVSVLFGMQIL